MEGGGGEDDDEDGDAGGSTPQQVAAFLYDATGHPVASNVLNPSGAPVAAPGSEQAGSLRPKETPEESRAKHARHASGMVPGDGDYVVDIHGKRLSPDEVHGMRDGKGRPIVIPRY